MIGSPFFVSRPCRLQTAQEYLESSDSEEEGNGEDGGEAAEGKAEEDEDRREEARIQKLWVKRAKRRRVLAEVEQAGAVDSQSSLLIQEVNLSHAPEISFRSVVSLV